MNSETPVPPTPAPASETNSASGEKSCAGRVAIVTGAGRGLGAGYALRLARAGACVVVNDLGVSLDGSVEPSNPAAEVVEQIRREGGQAVASGHDVADWDQAEQLVRLAIETFGRLDVLVNNAGVLRDRTIVKMTEAEWDSVIRVHLKGTFAPTHHAAVHWRERFEREGELDARLINTTSVAGLFGNVGQANYAAAKAGIVAFTIVASMELARYGVTANAISPGAATRMTSTIPGRTSADAEDPSRSVQWPAAVVEWLASPRSRDVTGRVILSSGRRLSVAQPWEHGTPTTPVDHIDDVDRELRRLLASSRPNADMRGGA
jgi:NAD(P)-dependent dehydrogenase (short-subunit alcohol dehydrogenase family)